MRAKGGEVLAYLNPTSRPDGHVCNARQSVLHEQLRRGAAVAVAQLRPAQICANSRMADMRTGSVWSNYVVSYVEKLMRERKVDGVFLDVVGARPWGISNWTTWSKTEKDAWTNGTVDLVRRIDAKRRAINPNFLILNNNIWDRGDGSTLGYRRARSIVDGVILEHPPGVTAYHKKYLQRSFSNLGHRRVMIIARNTTEAKAWAAVSGVTHVSNQSTAQYRYPTVPPISFKALTIARLVFRSIVRPLGRRCQAPPAFLFLPRERFEAQPGPRRESSCAGREPGGGPVRYRCRREQTVESNRCRIWGL